MLIAADQVNGLGFWEDPVRSVRLAVFGPSQAERERIAGDLTNLPIFKKQLRILRSKLDAARQAGAGLTPQYTQASEAVRTAEARLDEVNTMALSAYEQARRAGKVRPLDEQDRGELAGFGTVLTIVFAVALVVAAFVLVGPWLAAVAALLLALAYATEFVKALASLSPAVAGALKSVAEGVGSAAGAGAVIVLAIVGYLVFSKLRGARA